MTIRVRFAPSPTGHLHIGGARTALFNWLFARHNNGVFILRIEDTDTERSTEDFTKSILEGMRWLGMDWDEGPFYQSERFDHYRNYVNELVNQGHAYRCYCTAEELEAERTRAMANSQKPKYNGKCRALSAEEHAQLEKEGRPFTIRFKAPTEGTTKYEDICRGEISFDNKELDDLIILRSNGTPTYNLTVVVDDVDMKITHVIRGDDHINNTPRQIMLYKALDFPVPKFAHLPMILGPDKKKLSKRHGAVSVIEYEKDGFLPEAMINYLARLGWSYQDKEIFTKKELIELFDLTKVGSSSSVFDVEKCKWVNSEHLKNIGDKELTEMVLPYIHNLGLWAEMGDLAVKAIKSERERGKTFVEIAQMSAFYFKDEIAYNEADYAKWLNAEGKATLKEIRDGLAGLSEFNEATIGEVFKGLLESSGKKMLQLAQPCRVALTGTTVSPGIYEVIAILGKDKALARFDKALK